MTRGGFERDLKLMADFLGGSAIGNEGENLPFARGQPNGGGRNGVAHGLTSRALAILLTEQLGEGSQKLGVVSQCGSLRPQGPLKREVAVGRRNITRALLLLNFLAVVPREIKPPHGVLDTAPPLTLDVRRHTAFTSRSGSVENPTTLPMTSV